MVLRIILKQLIQVKLNQQLTPTIYKAIPSEKSRLLNGPADALRAYIQAEVNDFKEVFLLVDGLDQCPEATEKALREEFASFLKYLPTRFRVMLVEGRSTLPPPKRVICDVKICSSPAVLYWLCEICDFYKCQSCYEIDLHCSNKYVSFRDPLNTDEPARFGSRRVTRT